MLRDFIRKSLRRFLGVESDVTELKFIIEGLIKAGNNDTRDIENLLLKLRLADILSEEDYSAFFEEKD